MNSPSKKSSSRRAIGDRGESIAQKYLQERGYTLIMNNYQIKGGEIDIIAERDDITIFCEVRYRRNDTYGHPLDTLTLSKRRSLKRTIHDYIKKYSLDPEMIRVDFIGIMPDQSGKIEIWHEEGIEL